MSPIRETSTLSDPRLSKRLKDIGGGALKDSVAGFQAAMKKSGQKVWAMAILEKVNEKRGLKLALKEPEELRDTFGSTKVYRCIPKKAEADIPKVSRR